MRNFGASTTDLSNRAPTPAGFDASKSTLLANLTPYSRNDIVYCSTNLLDYIKKFEGKSGALLGGMPRAANAILASQNPTEEFFSSFIKEFARMQAILPANLQPTEEQKQCMQAIWWMEGELLRLQDYTKVEWNSANRIYEGAPDAGTNSNASNTSNTSNGSNGTNGEDDSPFYKQPWFVALGSLVGLSTVGYIGYNIFMKPKVASLPPSAQRFSHPVFN